MTYRERREARAERLREWAEKRDARAAASFGTAERIADGIPFGQPILVGHHSEGRHRRDADRIERGMRAGIESSRMADDFRSRADNIERAADRAIYSDDDDAAEKLRAKIADLEAQRDRWTAYNAACRAAGRSTAEAVALLSERQRADLDSVAKFAAYQLRKSGQAPAYVTGNLSGQISKARERLAWLERVPA